MITTATQNAMSSVERIYASLDIDEDAAIQGLKDFHRACDGVGELPRHFSIWPTSASEHRPHVEKSYDVPRWLETVIDDRDRTRVGATAKSMTIIGALVKPSLVKKVSRSPTPKNNAHAGVTTAQPVIQVRRSFLQREEEVLQRAVERIMAPSLRTGLYALTIIGSGLIGTVDGSIRAPWTVYNEWNEAKILGAEQVFRYRLLSGIDYGMERFVSESGEEQAPWIELDRQIMIVRSMLCGLRRTDRGALRAWYMRELGDLLYWAHECSWVHYEIESGEVKVSSDCIDMGTAMRHLDGVLDRCEDSYRNTFGPGGKHASE
jgi:hypothetical protein